MTAPNEHPFRLLNVFTIDGDRLSGNPLCVFESGADLSDAQMQALARQFNLSETTFILPPAAPGASARVRIFTPAFEMPFAGHPTLGTAHVVRLLIASGRAPAPNGAAPGAAPANRVVLEMQVGLVDVTAQGDDWTLRAARAPEAHPPDASAHDLAAMLGLPPSALGAAPMWIDTGSHQLVIPLATPDAVHAAKPDAALLARHAVSAKRGSSIAYVWAPAAEAGEVVARLFFLVHGGVVEDPATGSACANLGGWTLANQWPLPVRLRVHQGAEIGRPSLLHLHVDEARSIFVRGQVVELGQGVVRL